ncbi:MAG: hypothetical protein LWX83_11780, partial [Anaerolineae bacterium]|nr:hypothetical protein [Anaerolineae bacterium]
MSDLIWTIVGFILTLMVLSYILGDNLLFRLATYILIGASAGYVFSLIIYQVIAQRLVLPLTSALLSGSLPQIALAVVPVLLCIMLLFKLSSGRLAVVGNLPMAYLVGAGAAVLITGAVTGTLIGQTQATIDLFNLQNNGLIEALLVLAGTITTLAYFHFGARPSVSAQNNKRSIFVETLAGAGKLFIGITLGALFAGVYLASLSALIDRL